MFEQYDAGKNAPKDARRFNQFSPQDLPRLLEWHSSHCLSLADACETLRAKKILRLLAADLAIEAEALRRRRQERDLDVLTPHDGQHQSSSEARNDLPASRPRVAAEKQT